MGISSTASPTTEQTTLNDIAGAICAAYGFEPHDLAERNNSEEYADVRHCFCLLGKQYSFRYREIADFINRDTSTPISMVNNRMVSDEQNDKILEARGMLEGDLYLWAQKFANNPHDSYIQQKVVQLINNQ